MTYLCWCEIADGLSLPGFGGEFESHIAQKKHPEALRASLSAWNLLARMLHEQGCKALPRVCFEHGGKPYFADSALHFSLSHSGGIAAAILSDAPCAVDAEAVRPKMQARLQDRCMAAEEIADGCGFFETWTRKECIAKLDGRGMIACPEKWNTLDAAWTGRFFTCELTDSASNRYVLSALCAHARALRAEEKTII